MEAAASIVGIVSFGLGLAKSLQTFVETVIEAEETIVLIVAEVHATASTLKRLQDFIEQDQTASAEQQRATVFNETGLKEIGACALQCEKIYVQIIVLIEKASVQNGERGSKDNGPQASAADGSNASAVRLAVFSENVTKLGRKMRWPWLEPRIKRCQEHLGRLKVSLMLSLQIFLIAESRSRPFVALVSETNDDDDELRGRAETLRKKMAELRAKQNQRNPPGPNRRPPGFVQGVREVSVVSSATSEAPAISGDSEDTFNSNESISDGSSQSSHVYLGSDRAHQRRRSRRSRAVKALRTFKAYVRKRTEGRSVLKKDYTSVIFEAYLIHPSTTHSLQPYSGGTTAFTPPMKLPFGHRRLTREVKRALRKCNPWDVLLSLSPGHQAMVDQVVQRIQAASSNMSVCLVAVDIDGYSDAKIANYNAVGPLLRRMVLFFRLEPVYCEADVAHHRARVVSGRSGFTPTLGNIFQSRLRNNKRRKEVQARIEQERDEREMQETKNKTDKEMIEREKAEVQESRQALEVEKNRMKEEREILEAEKTRIAEEKESVETKDRALKSAERAVLESIQRGTAEEELKKIFEEERARKIIEEERMKNMMQHEASHKRLEEQQLHIEKAAAEKVAEEAKKSAGDKSPVKFKDAIGRKFNFPFDLVRTWKDMEQLVKQAFQNVETLSRQVQEGHYDLVDSEDQVILPSTWSKTIKPGAFITMRMWPMDRESPPLTEHGQYMSPQQRQFILQHRSRAAAAAAQAGHTHNHDGTSSTWYAPDPWGLYGGTVPPRGPPPGFIEGLPIGGAPLAKKKRKEEGRKKKPAFFGDNIKGILKSTKSKKFAHTRPVDSQARKSTEHGEGVVVEDVCADELAEDIDKELGLDDLKVPEQIASKDIDELLEAWTNTGRDRDQEDLTSTSSQSMISS